MTTQQNTLAAWLAQEDEQYQEYVKQRERRRIEWQSALDAALARAERAEEDVARLRDTLAEVVLDAEAIFSSPLVDEKLVLSAGGLYSLRSQLPKLRALTADADEEAQP